MPAHPVLFVNVLKNPSWIFQHPPPEKRGFPVACKINGLQPWILAVRPCTAGAGP